MNFEELNSPAKRLEYLQNWEGLWKWVWYLSLFGFGLFLAVKVVPIIVLGLDNMASLVQSLLWLGMWVVAFVVYLYVVTHKGLRQFLLRLFDHLVRFLDRSLMEHDPFTDAQISIDKLKERVEEVKQGHVNVLGAHKKVNAKIEDFEKKRKSNLTSAEHAREQGNTAKVGLFSRAASSYSRAIEKLIPQRDLTLRIATRLGDFTNKMDIEIQEQQQNLNIELETHGVLYDTHEATKSAYKLLSGEERERLDQGLNLILETNSRLAADADIFIRNTDNLIEMFKFEDEVKTSQAIFQILPRLAKS